MSSEAKLQSRGDWLKKRTETALGIGQDLDKNWPILAKIATVPGNENTFKKARHALQMLDRILDVFEPGQLGLSFNGGKDSVVLMLLLKEACDLHPTHSFTHVQPIWFQNPSHEFPEMKKFVQQVAKDYFTYEEGLKDVRGVMLNRLSTMHLTNSRDFFDSVAYLESSTSIRCMLIASRRSDPGTSPCSLAPCGGSLRPCSILFLHASFYFSLLLSLPAGVLALFPWANAMGKTQQRWESKVVRGGRDKRRGGTAWLYGERNRARKREQVHGVRG